jgi:hypothetical protein
MKSIARTEPALLIALVQATIALAVSFGLSLSPEQVGAVLALVAAASAVVVRQNVAPVQAPEADPRMSPQAADA